MKKFVLLLTASCYTFNFFFQILTYLFFISSDSPPNSLRALITFFKTSVCRHSLWKVCVREIYSEPELKSTHVFIDWRDRIKSVFHRNRLFICLLLYASFYVLFLNYCRWRANFWSQLININKKQTIYTVNFCVVEVGLFKFERKNYICII